VVTPAPTPDVQAIAIGYLLGRAELTSLVDTRIGSQLDVTKAANLPAVRVLHASTTVATTRRLDASTLDVEAWSTDAIEARDICALARALLLDESAAGPVGTWPTFGVVTGVVASVGPRPFPDPETATPRWLSSLIVYAHPLPAA
jgi:hypothetical protein